MTNYDILIQKFVEKQLSTSEKIKLQDWILSDAKNLQTFTNQLNQLEKKQQESFNSEKAFQNFMKEIHKNDKKNFTIKKYYKFAALLIIGLSIGYFLLLKEENISTVANVKKEVLKDEITIKLADGSTKIINNDISIDLKDTDGNTIASKNNGGLHFTENQTTTALVYNEISVPNSKTLQLILSDGTKVWLNAGTVFKFPQNFTSNSKNRTVYLQGEAFFEVTKNKNKPFIVDSKEMQVEVLGTKFNVSSYNNEDYISTTLVEGSVNVFRTEVSEEKIQLTPSYQAKFHKADAQFSKSKVDTRIYTSWIDNTLIINNLSFSAIIKKLERKYDVTITNKVAKLDKEVFRGEFKNETIETILKTISLSRPFTYTIDKNEITITK
jgi:hypothetical protein